MSAQSAQGFLIIPDITGYTEFLSSVELEHGQHIIASLLEGMIHGNQLGLTLSEIEGDALLYFRQGAPPTLEEVLNQGRTWLEGFHMRLKRMRLNAYCSCGACQNLGNLSLKVVAHHGELGRFRIGGQDKLIGKDVVLAHRLLKNSIDLREYMLLSGDLLKTMGVQDGKESGLRRSQETYPVFGSVEVGVADFSSLVANLPSPEERWEDLPSSEDYALEEITLKAPMDRAVWAVSHLESNVLWIEGLKKIIQDPSQPLGRGHVHICVLEGKAVEHEVAGIRETPEEFVMSFKLPPPKMFLKDLYKTLVLTREHDGVRMQLFIYYTRIPLLGRLFEFFALPKMRKNNNKSLRNLKNLLEKESVPKSSVA